MAVLGESLIYKHCPGVYGEGVGGSMYFVSILSFYLLHPFTPFNSSLIYFYSSSPNYCHIFSVNVQFEN